MADPIANYITVVAQCKTFLTDFKNERGQSVYADRIAEIGTRKSKQIYIELDDCAEISSDFQQSATKNVLRYKTAFYAAVDEILSENQYADPEETDFTVEDMFEKHRTQFANENQQELPALIKRRYELTLNPLKGQESISVRDLKGSHIGSLVKLKAMVTRITEVKPKMAVATYTCMQCGGEIFKEITSPTFMPLSTCVNAECKKASQAGAKLVMHTRGSKFVKFQEIRIQELAHSVRVGQTPRSLTVHARGETTRKTNPGDVVTITGVYLPALETGFAQMRTGLLTSTYIDVFGIVPDKSVDGDATTLSKSAQRQLNQLKLGSENNYEKLSQSLAPEIFGHEDVKKALILLLIGGVSKDQQERGLKVRGDLNMLLMGDPGVAKSQLLKYLCSVAPRGIYTTGKGSSGVGLTASVQRDPITEDLVLEGGALVLADKGICAIDEFDKMDELDRTAIYEVMEQQTISIAKAGITTTLNARTSIIAAANPLYGRYNDAKTLTENIDLPTALLSRFDLLFLILDRPNLDDDMRLAEHVTHVHQHSEHPDIGFTPISMEAIRAFTTLVKTRHKPVVDEDLSNYLVDMYVELRRKSLESDDEVKTTPRTLLSIIRLSTALARLRMSEDVNRDDIDEAVRLMNVASNSLNREKSDRKEKKRHYKDNIFHIIQEMLHATENNVIRYDRAKSSVVNRGYNVKQFESTLLAYQETSVLMVDDAKTMIKSMA